jgi:hypothetical protein
LFIVSPAQEERVSRINWGRVLGGGLIATIFAFLTDGFLHEALLEPDWKAVYDGLRATPPEHGAMGVLYFVVFELGRGLVSIFLYAMMRANFGPGPKTAAMAGVVSWFAFSIAGPAQFIPVGFYSHALWVKVAAFQLVTSVLAAIAGAAVYREPVPPAPVIS